MDTGHAALICPVDNCQSTFSHRDVLERHKIIHSITTTRYPCDICRKYRGQDGFKRKDHLTQHIRDYHHHHISVACKLYNASSDVFFCPQKDCEMYNYEAFTESGGRKGVMLLETRVFKQTSDFTAHMRKAHDHSPFPCPEPGCPRIGGKGYFRLRELFKHQQKDHATTEAVDWKGMRYDRRLRYY